MSMHGPRVLYYHATYTHHTHVQHAAKPDKHVPIKLLHQSYMYAKLHNYGYVGLQSKVDFGLAWAG